MSSVIAHDRLARIQSHLVAANERKVVDTHTHVMHMHGRDAFRGNTWCVVHVVNIY
jgi:hypothetical protein